MGIYEIKSPLFSYNIVIENNFLNAWGACEILYLMKDQRLHFSNKKEYTNMTAKKLKKSYKDFKKKNKKKKINFSGNFQKKSVFVKKT